MIAGLASQASTRYVSTNTLFPGTEIGPSVDRSSRFSHSLRPSRDPSPNGGTEMELRSHIEQGRPPQITRRSVAAGAFFVALKGALNGSSAPMADLRPARFG